MTPLDAVAAAIRERLLAGRPAPLPGLGTLVRQHVSARVEERPDGSRVLLPPGETIGLGPSADQESLAPAFGRLLGLADGEETRAYAQAMDQVEARLAATGEVRLPGVGLLRRTSSGVVLGVEADLLAAVNRTYEGLTPVHPVAPAEPEAEATETTPEPAAEEADAVPEESAEPSVDAPPAETASAYDAASPGVAEDSPLRDLSSDPGSPFDPPSADVEPAEPLAGEPVPGAYERPPAVPVTTLDADDLDRAGGPETTGQAAPSPDPGGEGSAAGAGSTATEAEEDPAAYDASFDDGTDKTEEENEYSEDGSADASDSTVGGPAEDDLDAETGLAAADLEAQAEDSVPEETSAPDELLAADESASMTGPAETADVETADVDDEPRYASLSEFVAGPVDTPVFDDAPGSDPALSPTDVSFVDDDTLDADLDDVLADAPDGVAVPFGQGAGLSEVLAPTPDDRAPEPDEPASAPALDDDWASAGWTTLGVASSLGDGPEIEDAEIVHDDTAHNDAAASDAEDTAGLETYSDDAVEPDAPAANQSPLGDDAETDQDSRDDVADASPRDATFDPAPHERPAVGPSDELAALMDGGARPETADLGTVPGTADGDPVGLDAADLAADGPVTPGSFTAVGPFVDDPPALPTDPSASDDLLFPDEAATTGPGEPVTTEPDAPTAARRFPWWLVALAVLVLAALLVAWLWPRLTASRDARPVTTVEREAPAAPAFVDAAPSATDDSLAGDLDGTAETTALGPADGGASVQASGGGRPAAAFADGLPASDLQALAGQEPVRPDADGYTFVVLSTPSRETADALHARFRGAGYRTTVLASDRGARTMYRLAVGQFATRDDADRLRDRLPPDAPADTWVLDLRTL